MEAPVPRRKPRLRREDCRHLDVTALAKEGLLAPGLQAGLAGSFSELVRSDLEGDPKDIPVASEMTETSGKVTVGWPNRQTLVVVPRPGPRAGAPW
jgi:hypothetical protein